MEGMVFILIVLNDRWVALAIEFHSSRSMEAFVLKTWNRASLKKNWVEDLIKSCLSQDVKLGLDI